MCFTVYSIFKYYLSIIMFVLGKKRGPQALFAITILLLRIMNLPHACQKGWGLGHGKDSTPNCNSFGAFQTSGASSGLIYLMYRTLWKQKGPMTCTLWEVDINMSATQNAKLQRMDFSAYVSCLQQHEHANKSFQKVSFTYVISPFAVTIILTRSLFSISAWTYTDEDHTPQCPISHSNMVPCWGCILLVASRKNYRGVSECELRTGWRDSTNVNDWSRCLKGTQRKVSLG